MDYALQTLWHHRQRFFPGALAVTFSALLVGTQVGLLMGLFGNVSLAVDRTHADVWVGGPEATSVDQGRPIPGAQLARLAAAPEVDRCEPYVQGRSVWVQAGGASEPCMVIGSRLGEGALGAVGALTPELRARLTEPGTVVVDEADLARLGVKGVGDTAEIADRRVRVVGLVRGFRGLANAYVFCSLRTARALLGMGPEEATFFLARCRAPDGAAAVVERFRGDQELSAFTREDFSRRSRLYWLIKTKAGLALTLTTALGLLIGIGITSQTMYAATAASLREYAVLRAMGIPRRRLVGEVLAQCWLIGLAGAVLALPGAYALAFLGNAIGLHVALPSWLLGGMALVTLAVALLAGLTSARLLLSIDPVLLLR
jgi:putative ABC transport system permease protein